MSINTEKELFDWLKLKISDLQQSEDKFSFWDCYSEKLKCRIELKCRRKHYNTLLIEKKKYDAMLNKCKDDAKEAETILLGLLDSALGCS